MQAAIARASATTTWVAGCPRAVRCRPRVHTRTWAFQPRGGLACGHRANRPGRGRLPWAGSRSAQAPACGDAGDGAGALDAPPRLAGLDDGGATPARARLSAGSRKALAACVRFSHGPALRREDERLGGRRTDSCRQPAPRGRPPRGPARRPAILAPPAGLPPVRGGLALPARLRTHAGAVTDGRVLDRGAIDRAHRAGTQQPGALGGVTSSGLDAVAGLLRDQGGGHDPAPHVLAAEIARAPGPAGPSCGDDDARCRGRGQGAETLVHVALAGAATSTEDERGVSRLTGLRDRDGRLVPLQPDRECASVTHG
jgi:hypothetical protein